MIFGRRRRKKEQKLIDAGIAKHAAREATEREFAEYYESRRKYYEEKGV